MSAIIFQVPFNSLGLITELQLLFIYFYLFVFFPVHNTQAVWIIFNIEKFQF